MKTSYCQLGYPDSNQERQDQNLQCYHYTIPQFSGAILNCGCKGTTFSGITKTFHEKFSNDIKKSRQPAGFLFYSLFSASMALIFSRMRFMSSFSF